MKTTSCSCCSGHWLYAAHAVHLTCNLLLCYAAAVVANMIACNVPIVLMTPRTNPS